MLLLFANSWLMDTPSVCLNPMPKTWGFMEKELEHSALFAT
jgi:hypothetical protein